MNTNNHINNLIQQTLNSLDGTARATPKPFLFTRLNARMQKTTDTKWDLALKFICKPAIALTVICLVIALNAVVVAFNLTNKITTLNEEQYTSLVDYGNAMAANYITENNEP